MTHPRTSEVAFLNKMSCGGGKQEFLSLSFFFIVYVFVPDRSLEWYHTNATLLLRFFYCLAKSANAVCDVVVLVDLFCDMHRSVPKVGEGERKQFSKPHPGGQSQKEQEMQVVRRFDDRLHFAYRKHAYIGYLSLLGRFYTLRVVGTVAFTVKPFEKSLHVFDGCCSVSYFFRRNFTFRENMNVHLLPYIYSNDDYKCSQHFF